MHNPGASPAESARTVSFAHAKSELVSTYIFGGVHLHEKSGVCSRSVGPFGPPKQEKGVQHFFFPFLDILFFSGCTESMRFPQLISTNSCGK